MRQTSFISSINDLAAGLNSLSPLAKFFHLSDKTFSGPKATFFFYLTPIKILKKEGNSFTFLRRLNGGHQLLLIKDAYVLYYLSLLVTGPHHPSANKKTFISIRKPASAAGVNQTAQQSKQQPLIDPSSHPNSIPTLPGVC